MKASLKTALQAIAFALAILLIPAATLADGFLDDDLVYEFLYGSDTKVCVKDFRTSSASHISIPSSVVYEYTDYSDKDEDGHYIVKRRTCRVTHIGREAFSSCRWLTSVTIPDSVASIGDWAFRYCTNLTSVTILGNVMNDYWVYEPFAHCTNIETIVLGEKMTQIGGSMFSNCPKVQFLTIPNSVTRIGSGAFSGCSGLKSLTIGNSVTNIEGGAFSGCSALTSVRIPDSVTSIGGSAFSGCSALTSVTIGNGVTSIGDGAFRGCSGLTNVTIPDSVASIGDWAFRYCTNLTSVTVLGNVTNDWSNRRDSHPPFYCSGHR